MKQQPRHARRPEPHATPAQLVGDFLGGAGAVFAPLALAIIVLALLSRCAS